MDPTLPHPLSPSSSHAQAPSSRSLSTTEFQQQVDALCRSVRAELSQTEQRLNALRQFGVRDDD